MREKGIGAQRRQAAAGLDNSKSQRTSSSFLAFLAANLARLTILPDTEQGAVVRTAMRFRRKRRKLNK